MIFLLKGAKLKFFVLNSMIFTILKNFQAVFGRVIKHIKKEPSGIRQFSSEKRKWISDKRIQKPLPKTGGSFPAELRFFSLIHMILFLFKIVSFTFFEWFFGRNIA